MAKIFYLIGIGAVLLFAQKKSKVKPASSPSSSQDTTSWKQGLPPFVKGVILFSQGLYEEAAEYFYKAAEAAPHSAGVHYYLSRLAYQQGDYIRMLTHIEKAYKEAPHEAWVGIAYAAALALNGQQYQSTALLEKLVQDFPEEPEILLRLAQSYQAAGEIEKADRYYRQLQLMGGAYEEVFQMRVQMFVEVGQVGRAIAIAESLAALWPKHEVYWETIARLYELSRNLSRMAEVVQHLLQIDPANQVGWGLVLAYPELFEEMWGYDVWEGFLESYTVPAEVKYALLRRGDFLEEEEYREALSKLLRENPMSIGWDLWAQYWMQNGRWDSAATAWKRALASDSIHLPIYGSYLYALWQLGGGDSLAREVERAQEFFPGQGRLFLWQGVAYAQQREWPEACKAFQRGWRLLPTPDTPLARVAAYYQAIAEIAQNKLTPQTRERFQGHYPGETGTALLALLLLRGGEKPAELKNTPEETFSALPSPLREWGELLWALSLNRLEEARRIASIVDTSSSVPLEMWEDILTRLGPQILGPAYHRWRSQAEKQYPLALLWRSLP
ncbi:MAG: tetratricopeptide repeat protein [Bacteroidia bacterium]|nr:tetratricopeptide repeat protein [Bacteroidia bacterium]